MFILYIYFIHYIYIWRYSESFCVWEWVVCGVWERQCVCVCFHMKSTHQWPLEIHKSSNTFALVRFITPFSSAITPRLPTPGDCRYPSACTHLSPRPLRHRCVHNSISLLSHKKSTILSLTHTLLLQNSVSPARRVGLPERWSVESKSLLSSRFLHTAHARRKYWYCTRPLTDLGWRKMPDEWHSSLRPMLHYICYNLFLFLRCILIFFFFLNSWTGSY